MKISSSCPKCDGYDPDEPQPRKIVEPGAGIEIPVDRVKYRVRFANESESHVDVIIEPKQ